VGVTGGIGAGKSVICRIFSILGIPVYDADTRAKRLMEHSGTLRQKIIDSFGPGSYGKSGNLNRAYLAELVFPDSEKVSKLNQLVHPEVALDYQGWAEARLDKFPYVIKEAALLIESGSYRQLDYLVSVVAPEELRIARTLARDPNRSRQQVESIISQQLQDQQRMERSDRVINNDEQEPLVSQVLELHQFLVQQV
jgi:dephospho-CoA kinase